MLLGAARKEQQMKPRWPIRLAWVLWGSVVATLAVDTLVAVADWAGTVAHGGIFVFVAFMVFVLAFSTVGVLIAARQPGNPIGWLLLGCAVGYALAGLAQSYADYGQLTRPSVLPGITPAAWAASWLFLTGAGPAATFLLLLFPTGRLPSRRWRVVAWLAAAGMALIVTSTALAPGPIGGDPQAPANPVGLAGGKDVLRAAATIGGVAFTLAILGSVISLIVRFRRARRVERQQLKWLSYAAVLFAVAALFGLLMILIWGSTPLTNTVENATTTGTLACVPVAVGIAILRYRLYDIDRLISRTLVYAVLTLVLGVGYAGVVLVLGQLFGGVARKPPSWAVAAATLAMAALFQPAQRRVQAVVDQRFNRRRYNAAKTVEAFSGRLRDQLDLDTLTGELLAAADQTMEPTTVSLWLRPPSEAAKPHSPRWDY
jgi:hypothetical protein